LLRPHHRNFGKRLVKRPMLYLADSGIFHSLIGVGRREELMRHNHLGASWIGWRRELDDG
jgi:hypothetical protein